MKPLILASASPRRQAILKKAGFRFTVDPSEIDENTNPDLSPHEQARSFSKKKAEAVAKRHADHLVLAADTLVVFRGRVLGKPKNAAEAHNTLMKLNGQTHQVITGFTVLDTRSGKTLTHSTETLVHFKQSSAEMIAAYVSTGEPLDKAGAYAIQGKGRVLVEKIEGSLTNVIGLPIRDVKKALSIMNGAADRFLA